MSDPVAASARPSRLYLAVALLTLAVYLVFARGLPTTFDEQIIADTTASLAHGHAAIHTRLLAQFPDLSVKRSNGSRVGIYGIGTSAVAVPLYAGGKVVGEFSAPRNRGNILTTAMMFTDAFITAATVFMLMLVCALMGAPPLGAVLIGLSFGLGSYAFPHAITFFTEPGTALFVIAAVYFAIKASRGWRRADLLACGACASTALLFRVSAALFLPLFGLWLLVAAARTRQLRRAIEAGLWFGVGAVGPLALMLLTNWWRYGSVTNFGYTVGTATASSYPILRGLAGQWLSSGKSLFLYAPVAVLAVIGIGRALKRLPLETCLLGSIVGVNTLFFARVQFWSGDWAWGPRYMQIVLPCLAAMAAPLTRDRVWRWVLGGLAVLGLVFAALPAVLVRFTLLFYAAFKAMPPKTSTGPVHWDHSYYALVWHTLHFQPILYQLRAIPHAFSNSLKRVTLATGPRPVNKFPGVPRIELWWLRGRDIGLTAVGLFALLPLTALITGVSMLKGYLGSGRRTGVVTAVETVSP